MSQYDQFDINALDDLVCWTSGVRYVGTNTRREFSDAIMSLLKKQDFLVSLKESELRIPDSELTTVLQGTFSENESLRLFVYVQPEMLEIHIPEMVMVTADPTADKTTRERLLRLLESLERIAETRWEFAEFGGNVVQIADLREFWSQFEEDMFHRLREKGEGE
ncbi:MAG: hypothetical protein R3C49_16615 [Planctomycetaceae bacterium]